eukprot:XP_001695275.1 predicted protein [Chlamydomonas reinhardtii]
MAALAATEHGRVRLHGMTRAAAALGIQTAAAAAPEAAVAGAVEAEPDLDEIPPTQLTPPQPGVHPVELACAGAVADFWSRLMQFAQLGVPQKGWGGIDATHPILAVVKGELDYDQRAGIWELGVLGKRCLARPGLIAGKYDYLGHDSHATLGKMVGIASAYCTSMVTWHMEHSGLPDDIAQELERLVARVVDRRLAPDSTEKRLTGIPTELLYGHPTTGGFGALPIRQHRQPWCVAYDVYLRAHHPSLRPSSTLTAVPVAEGAGDIIPSHPLPEDTERTISALGWLPPVQALTEAPEPGAWCFTAPLWGNPLLTPSPAAANGEQEEEDSGSDGETAVEPVPAGVARRTRGRGLDYRHRTLQACARLVTIGDLVRAHAARPPAAAAVDWKGLVGDIPPSWWSAAQAHAAQLASPGPAPVPAPSTSEVIRTTIMPRMGWKLSGSETLKVPLAKLSVRMATSMQLDDVATRRADLHEDYECAVQGLPPRAVVRREDLPAAAAATLGAIRDTLARLWQECRCREIRICRWLARREPCDCGQHGQEFAAAGAHAAVAPTPRQHYLWDCAVAKAVVAQINAHNPGPAPISQAQLWLVQAPPGSQQCVWDVVVMAALAATEHGRVRLRGMTRAAAALGIQTAAAAAPEAAVAGAVEAEPDLDEIPPTQLTPPQPGVHPVELARAGAVADFWSRLMQFAQLGVPQKGWDGIDATHLILAVVNGEMLCALPQAMELEA